MKPEPKTRRDKCCVVCRKKIPVLPNVVPDAFCSTVCCRVYFDTTEVVSNDSSRGGK